MLPSSIDSETIKHLSKPMVKLIEAIRSATGTLYEPTRIKKEAKAKAQAKVYEKIGELVCNELEHRGLAFFIQQQGKKQLNIDKIIEKTLSQQLAIEESPTKRLSTAEKIYDTTNPRKDLNEPSETWINEFFDLCQNSSEDEIQEIWAALLRKEVDNPGTVSRRLMHAIRIMSSSEAKTFQALASCLVEVKQGTAEIYDKESKEDFNLYYGCINTVGDTELYETETGNSAFGFKLHDVVVLEEIGLLNRVHFNADEDDARELVFSDEESLLLTKAEFELCDLTYLGIELSKIIPLQLNQDYYQTIKKDFSERNMVASKSS